MVLELKAKNQKVVYEEIQKEKKKIVYFSDILDVPETAIQEILSTLV